MKKYSVFNIIKPLTPIIHYYMEKEIYMNLGDYVALLSVIIGILTVIVAGVTIMFGYNLTIFRKKIYRQMHLLESKMEENLEKQKEYVDKAISANLNFSIKFNYIQNDILTFVDKEIKSGIVKHEDGLFSLSQALKVSAETKNPYISVAVLNQITKILIVTKKENYFNTKNRLSIINYEGLFNEYVDENIKIVENYNMQNLLLNKDGNYLIIKDCIRELIKAYS